MRKLYKRMFREIGSHFGQFLSIVLIIAVGSMLMSGMFASITAMDNSTRQYYDNQNMADLWGYFKGISEEEISSLALTGGVTEAEGRYTFSEQIQVNGTDCTLRLYSMTNINRSLLTDGALPSDKNEMILDYKFAEANLLTVGSKITVSGETLTVSGLCMNPEYAYKQKDTGAAISNRTFGIGYAQNDTLIALIQSSDAFVEHKKEVQEKLDDAESQIADAKTKLSNADGEYNENKAEADRSFTEAEARLQEIKKKLDDGQALLHEQKSASAQQLQDAQVQIDTFQEKIDTSKQTLDKSYAEYKAVRSALSPEQQSAQDAAFQSKYQELETQQGALSMQQSNLNAQKESAEKQIVQKQEELDNGYREYESNAAEFRKSKENAYARLNGVKAEIDKNRAELAEQEEEYQSQKKEAEEELFQAARRYQEVLFKTDNSEAVLSAVQTYESYITGVELKNQPSYVNVNGALDPIRSVSYLFPLIFFFVAAAVAFISLSKTVENQRTQIAVMQGLGVSKSGIRQSFLTYAGLASVFGSIPFALLGNLLIPKLLIRVFVSRFELPAIDIPMYPLYVLLPLLFAVLFSGLATLIAVQKVLKEIPAQAMRPRPPKSSRTILVERFTAFWSRLGYSNKLILRNLFLNKGRILLSSVGIIGSVMLILTGLSLRSSALQVVNTTMDSMSYDLSVVYRDSLEEASSIPFDVPVRKSELSAAKKTTLLLSEDVALSCQIVESGSELIHLQDTTGKRIVFEPNSVIIPDSVAKDYGLSVGDRFQTSFDDTEHTLTVTGISVQYTAKIMYLSFDSAKAAGIDCTADTLLVELADESMLNSAVDTLSKQDTVKSVSTKADIIARSKDMLKTLNATIFLILISAAVLAVTVIYNITSINIFERTREYATLMVLGYYKKEVNRLTLAENVILTAFGCLLGLPAGYYLFLYLAGVISRTNLQIPTGLDWRMAAVTIALTFGFTFISNLLLRPKIKNIVLVEALKSVE